jgi:hypothetical protein
MHLVANAVLKVFNDVPHELSISNCTVRIYRPLLYRRSKCWRNEMYDILESARWRVVAKSGKARMKI